MSEFDIRREKLLEKMEEKSIALIYSGVSKIASEDDFLPFCVNRNFYYLSGIEQEGSILMLVKGIGINKQCLFIAPFDPLKERWTGKKLTPQEASEISLMQNVYTTDTFDTMLSLAIKDLGRVNKIYLDLAPEIKIKDSYSTRELQKKYREEGYEVEDIYPMIRRLRMVKSDEEIEHLRKAIDKTNMALNKLMKALRPGVYEYELADLFEFSGREKGKSNLSFPTIVGAGINSTCLHYPTLNCKVQPGDIVLFDLGLMDSLYCADISRTYPVDGVFSELQRKIYEAVLNCNKAVIAFIKEGLTIADLQNFTIDYLKNECVRNKLIKPEDDIRKYYIHNVSHHLGLDTHDISDRTIPLERGNVITVEPGLYFPEYKIGVRIEDDVLVTASRAEVLSSGIIKEIHDIEKMLKTRK